MNPRSLLILATLVGSPGAVAAQELADLQRSCNEGDALACYEIGAMFRAGRSVERDPMRATVYLERACNAGAMPGCAELGSMYQRGEGVDPDTRRGIELSEQACEGEVFSACTSLGVLYVSGSLVPQDFERAHEYLDAACTGGDALGCANLGVLYQRGYGVDADDARAKDLFGVACRGAVAQACRLATDGVWELVRYEPEGADVGADVRALTSAGAEATLRITCTPERTDVSVEWAEDLEDVPLTTSAGPELTTAEEWTFDDAANRHAYRADGRALISALSGVEAGRLVASTPVRSASFVLEGLSVVAGPLATACGW